jgi:hypothetical protein
MPFTAHELHVGGDDEKITFCHFVKEAKIWQIIWLMKSKYFTH